MKISVANTGPCRKTLNIELPTEAVMTEYDKVVGKYSAKAAIPGFRKGKAPVTLVERHYKKSVMEEVKDNLVFDSYRSAIREKNINPVAVLDVKDVTLDKDKPMSYKIVLDVPPDFNLPKYKKISVKPNKVEVSDEQVQQRLNEFLDSMAEYKDVDDRSARKGDLVQIDYEGFYEDRPIAELDNAAHGLAQGRGFWAVLDENAFLPEMAEELAGVKVGECKEMKTTFPADFKPEFIAGKTAMYSVTIKAIREKKLPVIDEAFLKRIKADSEDDIRRTLREALVANAEYQEKERLKNEIIEELLKKINIDLPESLVSDETRNTFSMMARGMLRRGASREQVNEQKDQMLESASKTAAKRVKLGYVLSRIAEEENISVDDSEMESMIKSLAARSGVAPEELRKDLKERQQLDAVRNDILSNKTLDFILEHASAEEKDGFFGRLVGRK